MKFVSGTHQQFKNWWARHFGTAIAQFGLLELAFSPCFALMACAKPIDWETRWEYPVQVDDPSPWGLALIGYSVSLFLLFHGIGNLRNWKPAVAVSGLMGVGLCTIVAGHFFWYYGTNVRLPSGSGWHLFDDYTKYLTGWMYGLLPLIGGWNLVREARIQLSRLHSDHIEH